jgi:hypothetical protein
MQINEPSGEDHKWISAFPSQRILSNQIDQSDKQGSLKIPKHSKVAQVKVVLADSASIRPFLKTIGFMLAHKVTVGETSKAFKAKAVHSVYDMAEIWAKHYFGKDLIGHSRNIGDRKVLAKKEDFKAANVLLDQCKSLVQNESIRNIKIDPTKNPEASISDGICAGIRLDIAERLLIKRENLADIIESNQKGATAEAAANQAIYQLVSDENKFSAAITNLFDDLRNASKSGIGDPLFQVDFQAVEFALLQADQDLRYSNEPFEYVAIHSQDLQEENPQTNQEFAKLIRAIVDEAIQQARRNEDEGKSQTEWVDRRNGPDSPWTIQKPLEFQQAVLNKINADYQQKLEGAHPLEIADLNKKREKDIAELKWVTSFLEYKQGLLIELKQQNTTSSSPIQKLTKWWKSLQNKAIEIFGTAKPQAIPQYFTISDPFIRKTMEMVNADRSDDAKYHLVAQARGLKLKSLRDVLGHRTMHATDDSYLRNISKLKAGTYSVNFFTGDGAHALTYIKINEQEGYLLDPNGYQIRCKDPEHTIQQFHKLLALYEEPDTPGIFQIKGQPNHQLDFQEFINA